MNYSPRRLARLLIRARVKDRRWWRIVLIRFTVAFATGRPSRELLPFLVSVCFERRIIKRVQAQEVTSDLDDQMLSYLHLNLPEDRLIKAHEFELRRRESLISKGKANIVGVTIALAFIFGALGLQKNSALFPDHAGGLSHLLRVILGVATGYLLAGGFCAFHATRVNRVYDFSLQVLARAFHQDAQQNECARLIKMIHLNQAMNLVVANYASSSYTCMRNGIVGIATFVIIVLAT